MTAPKITQDDVKHVALLSRLHLTEEESKDSARVLNSILEHFATLNELDTENIEPTAHSLPMENVFRKDENRPSLPVEEALKNAPEEEQNCFKVPKIIQEM